MIINVSPAGWLRLPSPVLILCLLMSGCNTWQQQPDVESISTIQIAFQAPNRIRFSGKGAGAGMMLMSTMGATGIAIGVAIDEGIGKEIATAISQTQYAFPERFEASFHQFNAEHFLAIRHISVQRYGFKINPTDGVEDAVIAELMVNVEFEDGASLTINYPRDYSENLNVIPLEAAKTNGTRSSKMLDEATIAVLKKLKATRHSNVVAGKFENF